MKDTQCYSMGFLFDDKRERIVLIQKIRPNWQAGYWSVPGGHIEEEEGPGRCCAREFREEAWLNIGLSEWQSFAILTRPGAMVYCYMATSSRIDLVKTMTDETVRIFDVARVTEACPLLNGIQWLIPLALDRDPSLKPVLVPYTGLPLDQKEFRQGRR